ncbi:MAG TPA: endonuclease/exonuclease/phosphatase family protein, partial [Vicinamibacterales bacterium]|nr:endonuclease/exonuclease/phosphatase family protein [Vicinamibacterales bacterium]
MSTLRVISWNVHALPLLRGKRQRLGRIAAEIARRRPDVVLLQEVWMPRDRAALSAALQPIGYVPVDDGAVASRRRGGLLTLIAAGGGWSPRRSRFVPFTCAAPLWRVWEGDALGGKGAEIVDLQHPRAWRIVNTHLQSQYRGRAYADVRRAQVAQLAGVVADEVDTPTVVCGDFNTDADD